MNTSVNLDPKLKAIISEGLDGQLSIIGFPHDIGAKRDGVNQGAESGPDSLRRFFVKVGPLKNAEYETDLSNLRVTDYGNIYIKDNHQASLEELSEKLSQKVNSVYEKGNIPLVLGGSKDCGATAISQFIQKFENPYVICMTSLLGVTPEKNENEISIDNCVRYIVERNRETIQSKKVVFEYFGAQEQLIEPNDRHYIEYDGIFRLDYSLQKLRRQEVKPSDSLLKPYTQAAQQFLNLLDSPSTQSKQIHVSLSLEVLNSSQFPGVSRASVIGGINADEIVEIFFQAGRDPRVVSLDVTDYNPSREDYRSGLLLANIVYYFLMGYSLRIKK